MAVFRLIHKPALGAALAILAGCTAAPQVTPKPVISNVTQAAAYLLTVPQLASTGNVVMLPELPQAAATVDTHSAALPLDLPVREIERGGASWYGPGFHGRRTASGERYDMNAMTAAHRTLPFGTWVRVKSLVNGREVDVRITDRGPFIRGRVIDVSRSAAEALGMLGLGFKEVVLLVAQTNPASEPVVAGDLSLPGLKGQRVKRRGLAGR